MTYLMTDKLVAELKATAESGCWTDDPDFMVNDYSGGNEDDACAGGERIGRVELARHILDVLGIEYNKEEKQDD